MKKNGFAAGVFAIFLIIGALAATLLHLHGANFWILFGAFAALGLVGAGFLLWWMGARPGAAPAAADAAGVPAGVEGEQEVDLLVRQAELRLKSSKLGRQATLDRFPVILLMGETGGGKTSVVQASNLDPELLAGQVSRDNQVVPTRSVNLWFARQAIFAEAGGGLLAAPASWARLVRRIAPQGLQSIVSRQESARAAVVCVSLESVLQGSAAQALAPLRARLDEGSRRLGISLPVYVLFTKIDRVPFFAEYAENLTPAEANEVLGTTIPTLAQTTSGIYAEQETQRLTAALDELFFSLSDHRVDLLGREHKAERLPGIYEFPREFRKMRNTLVQFMVDLCRPSQLTTSPFLRGFYFTGLRSVLAEAPPAAEAAPAPPPAPAADTAIGATRVFDVGQLQRLAQQPSRGAEGGAGATRVFDLRAQGGSAFRSKLLQQPVFLGQLFHEIILKDRAGLATSGASARVSFWRRLLLACAAAVCIILGVGFLISYLGNRGLESAIGRAAAAAPASANASLPNSLQQLESLRKPLVKIGNYNQNGAPWHLRWGLFAGPELYPAACSAYAQRFKTVLLDPTQAAMVSSLMALPTAPSLTPAPPRGGKEAEGTSAAGGANDYGTAYDVLRAYLITTTNPQESTEGFLAPELYKIWTQTGSVDPQSSELARTQFDFYSTALPSSARLGDSQCFASNADADVVAHARAYLNQFPPEDRVYRAMLADVTRNSAPIIFSREYPNSADVVTDSAEVSGAYTQAGWNLMQKILQNPEPYMKGEPWVLGTQVTGSLDPITLAREMGQRYQTEFVDAWRKFLAAGRVVPYGDLADARGKLGILTSNTSPLLELFWLVSNNVSVNPNAAAEFQPVAKVVPASQQAQYVSSSNQNYLGALLNLKSSLDQFAQQFQSGQAGILNASASSPVTASASQATTVAEQMAMGFTPDPRGHVDDLVKRLMLEPITNVQAALPKPGQALNAQGRSLCAQYDSLARKYPFSSNPRSPAATVAELNNFFLPNDGVLARFYAQNLSSLVTFSGSEYMPKPGGAVQLSPSFMGFFNRCMALERVLYPNGSSQPELRFQLSPLAAEGVKSFSLTIGSQTMTYPGGAAQFTWSPATAQEAKQTVGEGGVSYPGPWGIFALFRDAQWQTAASGYDLTWVQKNGERILYLPSGKPMTVGVHLDMLGAPPIFRPGYFSGNLGCVSRVAE